MNLKAIKFTPMINSIINHCNKHNEWHHYVTYSLRDESEEEVMLNVEQYIEMTIANNKKLKTASKLSVLYANRARLRSDLNSAKSNLKIVNAQIKKLGGKK